jgi:hypothetical protein
MFYLLYHQRAVWHRGQEALSTFNTATDTACIAQTPHICSQFYLSAGALNRWRIEATLTIRLESWYAVGNALSYSVQSTEIEGFASLASVVK